MFKVVFVCLFSQFLLSSWAYSSVCLNPQDALLRQEIRQRAKELGLDFIPQKGSPENPDEIQTLKQLNLDSFPKMDGTVYEHSYRRFSTTLYSKQRNVYYELEDIEFTLAQNRYFRQVPVGQLAPGSYNFVFTSDGEMTLGRVFDSWEFGARHFVLAQGRPVIVAGRLEVLPSSKGISYNLVSGTYSLPLRENKGDQVYDLINLGVSRVLKCQTQGEVTFQTDEEAPDLPYPGALELELLCKDPIFLKNNSILCPFNRNQLLVFEKRMNVKLYSKAMLENEIDRLVPYSFYLYAHSLDPQGKAFNLAIGMTGECRRLRVMLLSLSPGRFQDFQEQFEAAAKDLRTSPCPFCKKQ